MLGEGQKITPSGYHLPKRRFSDGDHPPPSQSIQKKKKKKSSITNHLGQRRGVALCLVVSGPSPGGPTSNRLFCPPTTYTPPRRHHTPLFSFIVHVSSVPSTNYVCFFTKNSRALDNMYKPFVQSTLLSQKITFAIFRYADPIKSPRYTTSVFCMTKTRRVVTTNIYADIKVITQKRISLLHTAVRVSLSSDCTGETPSQAV